MEFLCEGFGVGVLGLSFGASFYPHSSPDSVAFTIVLVDPFTISYVQ
jgi:hypothetical protein